MADEVLFTLDADSEPTIAAFDQIDAAATAMGDALSEAVSGMTDQFATLTVAMDEVAAAAATSGEALAGVGAAAATAAEEEAADEAATFSLSEAMTTLGETAAGVGEALTAAQGPLMMIGAAAALVGGKLVSMGMDGQKGEALLSGMAGASQADIVALQGEALKLGLTMDKASEGFYEVESAGYSGSRGITVFDAAMRLAEGGQAQAGDVTTGLTAIMHDYGIGADQAGSVTDKMAEAVLRGKQQMEDFATSIGPLASAGHNAGVGLNEVLAAESTMTQINPHVRQDTMQLAGLFQSLSPTMGHTAETAKSLGLHFNEAHFASLDLIGKLQYLSQIAGGDNTAAFIKLTGGVRGSTAAIDLLTGKSQAFRDNLNAMGHSAGATGRAFDAWESTIPAHLDKVGASLSVFATKTMDALGPQLIPVIDKVTTVIGQMSDLIINHTNDVIPVLTGLGAAFGTVLVIGIGMFIAVAWPILAVMAAIGLAVAGVTLVIQHWGDISGWVQAQWQTATSGISGFFTSLWNGVTSKFESAKNTIGSTINSVVGFFNSIKTPVEIAAGAITLFFLPAMIKAGVEAAVSGGKIAVSFVQSMIKTGTEATINGAKTSAQFVASMVKSGAEAVINGAKVTASFIASMVKAGAEAVVNGAKITAQFVASIIKAGIEGWQSAGKLALMVAQYIASGVQAALAGAKIAAQFVASIVKSGVEAAIAGAKMLVSLIPAIISVATEGIIAAATAIPGLVIGFIAWAGAAGAAAIATLLAAWPILLIIAAVALLVVGIYLLVTHWGQVTTFLRTTWQAFTTWLMGALHSIGQFFTNIWNGILNFIKGVWQHIVDFVKQYGILLLAIVLGPMVLIVAFVIQHWSQILAFIEGIGHSIVKIVQQLWQDVVNLFSDVWNKLLVPLGQFELSIINWFAGLANKAITWGEDLIKSLISGITNMLGNLQSTVSNVAGTIRNFLHFSKPDTGPLSDADQYMPDFMEMMAQGIEGHAPRLKQALSTAASSLASSITPNVTLSGASGGIGALSGGGGANAILMQILGALLQSQRGGGGSNSNVSTVQNNSFNLNGVQNIQELYNFLNSKAGEQFESGLRGSY